MIWIRNFLKGRAIPRVREGGEVRSIICPSIIIDHPNDAPNSDSILVGFLQIDIENRRDSIIVGRELRYFKAKDIYGLLGNVRCTASTVSRASATFTDSDGTVDGVGFWGVQL